MSNHDYQHQQAAHCETGAISSLLRHYGLNISEPMALGLASGIIFVHMPWIKVGGLPLTAYRMWPGAIIKGLQSVLGIKMVSKRYRNADAGMADLDALLERGEVVGLQTSVYWLPYFPPEMRFHFNAHNLVVYGKEGGEYLISDPVFEYTVRCPEADLKKARFTKGVFAPKGLLYYPKQVPSEINVEKLLKRVLRKSAFQMLSLPLPFMGIRGIHSLAKQITRLSNDSDPRYARLFLGNVVRMQEEIGTGGAGFRFMYASFLQEAAELTNSDLLREASQKMTTVGDEWREFALHSANFVRKKPKLELKEIGERLHTIAEHEAEVFRITRSYR
ncbi:MAG: BtrH N-terminal domain-containing protein [Pseudomonadota bacterium]